MIQYSDNESILTDLSRSEARLKEQLNNKEMQLIINDLQDDLSNSSKDEATNSDLILSQNSICTFEIP